MNKYALFHQSDSRYAYALGEKSFRIILRTAHEKFGKIEILYNNKYDFTKRRDTAKMVKFADDGLFDYYKADFELSDVRLAYIFRIEYGGRTYYFSEDGIQEDYDFTLAYYTFFQFPYINGADVMPVVGWSEKAVFYQIFIDRFARGNFKKDDSYINRKWEEKCDRYTFAGGDLNGITAKLGYIKDLGVNALYLTPVFKSETNHKYSITDYSTVDPQFGDKDDIAELLTKAHAAGIRIIIDAVFNHCDKNHACFQDVLINGKNSEFYDSFIIDGDFPDEQKGNYAHFADCKYMPKWNTNDPRTRRYLIDIALDYLGWGFDGLRLDVADELSHEFLRQLRREVKEKYPDALLLGEVWHNNRNWLRGEQLDGVMNYKLQKILADYFGAYPITAKQAAERMNGLLLMNTEQANTMALNFLDNHDTPRFFRFTGGNKDKLLCALCAVFVFPGMPCVFYGTELPLDGGGDPDCRQTFDWTFSEQSGAYAENFKTILGLKRQPALTGGNAVITAENGVLKIVRNNGGERITAYFNTSGKVKSVVPDGEVLFSLNCKDGKIYDDGAAVIKINI